MARIVEITQPSDNVTGDENRRATVAFTVSNINDTAVQLGAKMLVDSPAREEWFDIQGGPEWDLAANGTDQITVRIEVPAEVEAGRYNFRLLVYSIEAPSEDFTKGELLSFKVKEIPNQPPSPSSPFPIWIVVVVLGVLLTGGGITWYLLAKKPSAPHPPPAMPQPFSAGKQGASLTPLNDDGQGNMVYLDRHAPDCGVNSINEFRLTRAGTQNQYQYRYTCTTGGQLTAPVPQSTRFDLDGGGNAVYLDRHNVECSTSSVLTKFHLTRGPGGTVRYDYSCAVSKVPLVCRDTETPFNAEGGGNALYLDRHDIVCNSNEAISQFRLSRSGQGTFHYVYRCCSVR